MRWADTDSEDSDDEFQTHTSSRVGGAGVVNASLIDLSVSCCVLIIIAFNYHTIALQASA